jgi:hypothetical protein
MYAAEKLTELWDVHSFPARAEIEAALRALPEGPEASCAGLPREFYINTVVDELCYRGLLLRRADGDGRAPPHYRPGSVETVTNELKELKDRAEKLARKTAHRGRDKLARKQLALLLRSLHAPTIEALGDAPVFMVDGVPRLPVFTDILRGLPDRLEQGLTVSEQDMRLVALLAEHALTWVNERNYPQVGRPPDRQAHIIADLLATAYHDLTGRKPTRTTPTDTSQSHDPRLVGKAVGEWPSLVEKIFAALGVERAAWWDAVRTVREEKRGLGRRK